MIQSRLVDHHFDSELGRPCECGTESRLVQCHFDCQQYKASCAQCFAESHRNNPFHWASVWNEELRFFVHHDRSMLLADDTTIHLGHNGFRCPNPTTECDLWFNICHTNGIHGTRLRFCGCNGLLAKSKARQLLDARLFPSTMTDPQSAFTFAVLKEYHIHHLQSKCSAYDYFAALQRLTDNAFTADVPVSPTELTGIDFLMS